MPWNDRILAVVSRWHGCAPTEKYRPFVKYGNLSDTTLECVVSRAKALLVQPELMG